MVIAVGEKKIKSAKTDASLHNGQPTDTDTMCHCVGVTSCTLSVQTDKNGIGRKCSCANQTMVRAESVIRQNSGCEGAHRLPQYCMLCPDASNDLRIFLYR